VGQRESGRERVGERARKRKEKTRARNGRDWRVREQERELREKGKIFAVSIGQIGAYLLGCLSRCAAAMGLLREVFGFS
jgi:hypothetical protein